MARVFSTILLMSVVIAQSAWAGGYSRGGAFTAPGYGSREWGMAGAAVANGGDESAAYWNPALLSVLRNNRAGASFIDLVPGTNAQQTYLAYGHILKRAEAPEPGLDYNVHAFGIVYSNLRIDLPAETSYSENTLRLAYALAPEPFVSIGVGFNLLMSSSNDFGEFGAKGSSIDAGLRLRLLERWAVALVGRNLFSRINYDDNFEETMERSVTFGVAHQLGRHVVVEGDAVMAFGGVARYVLGGEAVLFGRFLQLRGGIAAITAGEGRAVPHAGLGIRVRDLRVDYNANFDTDEGFGDTHRFALGIEL